MTNSNISVVNESEAYDLPENVKAGRTYDLPKRFIFGVDTVSAPYWELGEPDFTAFIHSVKKTDDPNILEIEYWVYRSNPAYCSGYYHKWDTGKAMVDISTHRRWNVA